MSITRNTSWNLFGALFPLLVGFVCIPFILENIGVERLGILTIIWALIGYFTIFDFGLGRALTYQIALFRSTKNDDSIIKIINSGLFLTFFAGIFGGVILYALLLLGAVNWLNFSSEVYADAEKAIHFCVYIIPLVTISVGLRGVLEGYEDFKSANIIKIVLGILNFTTPVISIIFFGESLYHIVIFLCISRVLTIFLHIVAIKINNSNIFVYGWAKKQDFFNLLSFGGWMTVSNLVSPLMVISDRFIISAYIGASVVAYYTIPAEFMMRFLMIPAALTTTLFPLFAMQVTKNIISSKILYIKSLKLVSLVMGLIMFLLAVFSYKGLELWLGQSFAYNSYIVLIILTFGIFFNSLAQVPHTVLQSGGNVKITAFIHLFEASIYIPALLIITPLYVIHGVAFVWATRALIDLILLLYFCNKKLNLSYN